MAIQNLSQGEVTGGASVPIYDPRNGADRRVSVAELVEYVQSDMEDSGALLLAGALDGSVGLAGVTYDGSNRVTAYVLDGVYYVVTYPSATTIVHTGNDGSGRTLTLDGSGRLVGVA